MEALRGVRRVAGVKTAVFHIGEALVELLLGDVDCGAEVERVERLHVARYEHTSYAGWLNTTSSPLRS